MNISNNLPNLTQFCQNIHQDVGIEFGCNVKKISLGVAFNFSKEEIKNTLNEVKLLLKSKGLAGVHDVFSDFCEYELIGDSSKTEDIGDLIWALEYYCETDIQDLKSLNRELDAIAT